MTAPSMNHLLLKSAESNPEVEALVFGSRRRTFAGLAERVSRIAGAFGELGVGKGDVVPILATNSDRYFEYLFAVGWADAVTCPLNWRWNPHEIAAALDECGASLLLVGDGFETVAASVKDILKHPLRFVHIGEAQTPAGMTDYEDAIAGAPALPPSTRGGDDLYGIYYTGGTTGRPKGVMLSHAGVVMSGTVMLVADEVRDRARYMRCVPMFHYGDTAWSLGTLMRGGANIVIDRFEAEQWLSVIEAERVTATSVVPSMLTAIHGYPGRARHDVSSLEHLTYGGSPISPSLLALARAAFPNAGFSQGYGMTEYCSNMTILSAPDHIAGDHKLASAGRTNFATRMRIVDPESGMPVASGQRGEVQVTGSQLMLGYFKREDQTAQTISDGWLRTGDVGYVDDEGYLFLVDRLKDMIVTGGENVYSAEVERALSSHPAIAEAAVIGIPHERWGEAVHAVVVLRPGLSATVEEIREHCMTLIARFKCPASVEFRNAMPLSAFGKISKPDLRAQYWGDGRQVN
jgi:acyl-CoA synthetase (AMP-forming)/AMP-acid ligase II